LQKRTFECGLYFSYRVGTFEVECFAAEERSTFYCDLAHRTGDGLILHMTQTVGRNLMEERLVRERGDRADAMFPLAVANPCSKKGLHNWAN
jgi:hypothetical protein